MQHLRRQVIRRAHDCLEFLEAVLSHSLLAQAEVNDLDAVVGTVHYIFWFEVAVRDALTMDMVDCEEERLHDAGGLLFREHLLVVAVNQLFEQLAALTVLHDQVKVVWRLIRLEVFDDVGVVEGRQDANLVPEHIDLID